MNLLIRADASVAIGTGHVMRCLALAQGWQDAGGDAVFAMAETTPAIEKLLAETCEVVAIGCEPGSAEDTERTVAIARQRRADWVVLDGYRFSADCQRSLKEAGFKVFFVDDYGHTQHYYADVVLNQNVHAHESAYEAREAYTRLLLGLRYCMLRREFVPWRGWKRQTAATGRKVLITMGGSDPGNLTGCMMKAIRELKLDGLEVTVVVGGSNPHFTCLQKLAADSGNHMTILRDVRNLAELMAQSDVAISAAGSTCWEMCLLQLPMVLIDVAENQTPIAKGMQAAGAAIHAGGAECVRRAEIASRVSDLLASASERISLSQRCGQLVDGLGTERVLREFQLG
jgi:UDP-2,4-diacetamido-2,4,6-trideoxy-beta-L-altropyranose hydrolase